MPFRNPGRHFSVPQLLFSLILSLSPSLPSILLINPLHPSSLPAILCIPSAAFLSPVMPSKNWDGSGRLQSKYPGKRESGAVFE
jgi:hypothetical protein